MYTLEFSFWIERKPTSVSYTRQITVLIQGSRPAGTILALRRQSQLDRRAVYLSRRDGQQYCGPTKRTPGTRLTDDRMFWGEMGGTDLLFHMFM